MATIEKPSTGLIIVLEDFIVGPSTSVSASIHIVRGTGRGRGGRGRGGWGRGGRDAAAETEQENRMSFYAGPTS